MKKLIQSDIMKNILCVRFVPVLLGITLFAASCATEDEEDDTKPYIPGSLVFSMPTYVDTMDTYALHASGLTEPSDAELVYFWTGSTLFIKDTVWGQDLTITIPDTLGEFSIIAHAKAEGYYQSAYTHTMQILRGDDSFCDYVQPATYITDSRDGRNYSYTEIGSLLWFTRNLNWEGAGEAYTASPAMGDITGRLYTWEDATGGVDASGLGQGVQGVCPEGWSIPTAQDWEDFGKALYGKEVSFGSDWEGMADKLRIESSLNGNKFWAYSPTCNPENLYGWAALTTGYCQDEYAHFRGLYEMGLWLCGTLAENGNATFRFMNTDTPDFRYGSCGRSSLAVAVRCVKLK